MDILSIRDKVREGETTAQIYTNDGMRIGDMKVLDIMAVLSGMDTLDVYGEFTADSEAPKSTPCNDLIIEIDGTVLAGGMLIKKGHRDFEDIKKLYQAAGAREGRVYWHAETGHAADLQVDAVPVLDQAAPEE